MDTNASIPKTSWEFPPKENRRHNASIPKTSWESSPQRKPPAFLSGSQGSDRCKTSICLNMFFCWSQRESISVGLFFPEGRKPPAFPSITRLGSIQKTSWAPPPKRKRKKPASRKTRLSWKPGAWRRKTLWTSPAPPSPPTWPSSCARRVRAQETKSSRLEPGAERAWRVRKWLRMVRDMHTYIYIYIYTHGAIKPGSMGGCIYIYIYIYVSSGALEAWLWVATMGTNLEG